MNKIEKIFGLGTEIIDITVDLSKDTEVWTGDKTFGLFNQSNIADGDVCNLTSFEMSSHLGTHIDFPRHIIENGKNSSDYTNFERFILPVLVHDFEQDGEIVCRNIPVRPDNVKGLLLKGQKSFLSQCSSRLIADYGYQLLGVESMTVDNPDSDFLIAHRTLLSQDILIIENLDLSQVKSGTYTLIALPLKIKNAEACPARCILIENF